jgi:hypothetical protein
VSKLKTRQAHKILRLKAEIRTLVRERDEARAKALEEAARLCAENAEATGNHGHFLTPGVPGYYHSGMTYAAAIHAFLMPPAGPPPRVKCPVCECRAVDYDAKGGA